jgi:alpha-glutamyl/putrescinyl thymine pyrophosphorylase clade 1
MKTFQEAFPEAVEVQSKPTTQAARDAEFAAFVIERQAIYQRKTAGQPKPWTSGPILGAYSFCNMIRENDRVSTWLRENWFESNAEPRRGKQ